MTTETAPPRAERWPGIKAYGYNEKRPRGEVNFTLLGSLAVLHLGALLAVLLHVFVLGMPSTKVLVTAGVMYVLCGLGISMGNHRFWTHGGFTAPRIVRILLLIAAGLTLEGPVLNWVPDHWWHHIKSDLPGDMHSPYQYGPDPDKERGTGWARVAWYWDVVYGKLKGIGWAHVGWLWNKHHRPPAEAIAPNKLKWILTDRDVLLQKKFEWTFFIATFAIPAAICGWDGILVAGFLRIVLFLNVTWCVNSICHVFGRTVAVRYRLTEDGALRTKRQGDGSRNNIWLGLPTLGESYHALHHLFDSVAYHGWGRFDLDPTKWLLIVLEKLHVITDVVHPPIVAEVSSADLKLSPESLIWKGKPPTVEID